MVIAENPYDVADSPDTSKSYCHIILKDFVIYLFVFVGSTCSLSSSTSSTSSSIYYVDQPSPILNDFKPFDLESWWGRRLYQNITKSL